MTKKKNPVSSVVVEKGKQDIVQHDSGSVSMGSDGVKLYRLIVLKNAMEGWFNGLRLVKHDVFEQARKEFGLVGERKHDVYVAFCEMHGLEQKVTWDPKEAAQREDEETSEQTAEQKALAEFIKKNPVAPGPSEYTVLTAITRDQIAGILCTAFEGGFSSWASLVKYVYAEGVSKADFKEGGRFYDKDWVPYLIVPQTEGCALIIKDVEDGVPGGPFFRLDRCAIQHGLTVMREKAPRHFADFINENDDAVTGDVFLQCCLFGEVVYG